MAESEVQAVVGLGNANGAGDVMSRHAETANVVQAPATETYLVKPENAKVTKIGKRDERVKDANKYPTTWSDGSQTMQSANFLQQNANRLWSKRFYAEYMNFRKKYAKIAQEQRGANRI